MKRLYLIIMLIIGFRLFSLDSGLITGFEVGYNILEGIQVNNKLVENNNDSLYIQMKMGYRIENLRIIGAYTNTLKQKNIDSYIPVQDNFKIDVNYTLGNFKIGFFHFCDHPVVSQVDTRSMFVNRGQRAIYVGYYREF